MCGVSQPWRPRQVLPVASVTDEFTGRGAWQVILTQSLGQTWALQKNSEFDQLELPCHKYRRG